MIPDEHPTTTTRSKAGGEGSTMLATRDASWSGIRVCKEDESGVDASLAVCTTPGPAMVKKSNLVRCAGVLT